MACGILTAVRVIRYLTVPKTSTLEGNLLFYNNTGVRCGYVILIRLVLGLVYTSLLCRAFVVSNTIQTIDI